MSGDWLLKPLPSDLVHYPLTLDDRTLIMAPSGHAGHASIIELRGLHDPSRPPADVDAIAGLICKHLNEQTDDADQPRGMGPEPTPDEGSPP